MVWCSRRPARDDCSPQARIESGWKFSRGQDGGKCSGDWRKADQKRQDKAGQIFCVWLRDRAPHSKLGTAQYREKAKIGADWRKKQTYSNPVSATWKQRSQTGGGQDCRFADDAVERLIEWSERRTERVSAPRVAGACPSAKSAPSAVPLSGRLAAEGEGQPRAGTATTLPWRATPAPPGFDVRPIPGRNQVGGVRHDAMTVYFRVGRGCRRFHPAARNPVG